MAPPVPALSLAPEPSAASSLAAALDRALGRARFEDLLGPEAARVPARLWQAALYGPAGEFLARPGKQLRARLVATAYALAGGSGELPPELGLAIEALHAGSLVVDDIQDGAQVRRGREALHRMVGVPLALNAGNWMYFWAGQLIDEAGLADGVRLQAHTEMNRTMVRCHHGQALDLAARVDQIARAELPSVVAATTRLKTAALFELATRLGALAAGASAEVIDALGRFGASLGTALQMLDDLSGLASAARLDKAHEDLSLGRPTWPWAWLAERQSDADFRALLDARLEIELGPAADAMAKTQLLAETMRLRVGGAGRLRIRALLDLALARLREHFGDAAADSVERDVERLEQSYA